MTVSKTVFFQNKEMTITLHERLASPVSDCSIAVNASAKLPCGAVKPAGWLKEQLEIALNGMPGKLWKYSDFLAEGNGWLCPEKNEFENEKLKPWEEGGCFLRYYTRLAVLTGDEEALKLTGRYMDALLKSASADGYFGSKLLLDIPPEIPGYPHAADLWGHMMVCEAIWSWYEFTGEKKYLDLLHNFLIFCGTIPDEKFIPDPHSGENGKSPWHWHITVQYWRACEILPVIFQVYEAVRDERLLEVADRFYRRWPGAQSEYLTPHTVNFAQEFIYDTIYSRRTHCGYRRKAADYWYDQHMAVWGTLPRGAFCADELIRTGCTDPRYAIESCTLSEFPRSFQLLGELNCETVWADRTEDIIFNYYPAAFTYDMNAVHYLTAANQVMLDDYPSHCVYNLGHTFGYSTLDDQLNRCCRHNAALGWPLFTENLIRTTADHGLCAWMYAPCSAGFKINGVDSCWKCNTNYPFSSKVQFVLEAGQCSEYTFYLRIPRWCCRAELSVNGQKSVLEDCAGKLAGIRRSWQDLDTVELDFLSEITLNENPRNGGVTVDKGPFSYSLCIPEKTQTVVSSGQDETFHKEMFDEDISLSGSKWIEILPQSAWNYGLLTDKEFVYSEKTPDEDTGIFQWDKSPCFIYASARKIPAWQLQDHMCAELQKSPVKSSEPDEIITLIPMGCARLRLSVFPVISDAAWANEWQSQPETTPLESRPPSREKAY